MNELSKDSIESISNLEFINNLDDIFYNLLYSAQNGYINLHSKNAVNEFSSYIEKFDWEISKISNNIVSSSFVEIINNKKEEFIKELRKHYLDETKIWAQEVFDGLIENILFQVSLNKQDSKKLDVLYARALSAIGWISDIRKHDSETRKTIVAQFNQEFKNSINTNFSEFVPKERPNKTDCTLFLKLLKLYRENNEEFALVDFSNMQSMISQEDVNFFNLLKMKSLTNEKIVKDDEIDLIFCAVSLLNLKSDNHKYIFIKQLIKDFDNFILQYKKITEEDKILLARRRIELFRDSISTKKEYKYFKSKLVS